MSDNRGVIREIAWKEIFPWLSLGRALRLAVQARLLALASVAVLATMVGWWLLAFAFSGADGSSAWLKPYQATLWSTGDAASAETSQGEPANDSAAQLPRPQSMPAGGGGSILPNVRSGDLTAPSSLAESPRNAFTDVAWTLSSPFRQLFHRDLTFTGLAFVLLCGLWTVAVWSVAGGAITRTVAVQLAREESIGLGAARRFARRRLRHYFIAPLFPLFGVLLFVIPMALFGLLLRWDGVGVGIVGLVWPLYLVAGLLMAIFVVGLLLGWPLLFTTISVEGGDSFGAMSHAYSYVFQRPLYYLFLVVLASLLGALAWLAVSLFAETVIYLAAWGASWGGGTPVLQGGETFAATGRFGAGLIDFWTGLVRLATLGFAASYFWSASTAIYFLLRLFDRRQRDRRGFPGRAGRSLCHAAVENRFARRANGRRRAAERPAPRYGDWGRSAPRRRRRQPAGVGNHPSAWLRARVLLQERVRLTDHLAARQHAITPRCGRCRQQLLVHVRPEGDHELRRRRKPAQPGHDRLDCAA